MQGIDEALIAALKKVGGERKTAILQLLKGDGKPRERKQKPTMSIPEPYSMVCELACRTCGTRQEQYFNMVRDEVRGCLVSVATQIRPMVFVTIKRERTVCAQCKVTLLEMEKEEIVERFMKVMLLVERLL